MEVKKDSVVVILSGGQDSTTTLFWAKQRFKHVHAITFDYGQKHIRELQAARKVAELANVDKHVFLKVGDILGGTSPLTTGAPVKQLESLADAEEGVQSTFVPGRNLLFLTLAANYCYTQGILHCVMGVCEADYGGYPDCRMQFIVNAQNAVRLAMSAEDNDPFVDFRIHAPLMYKTKAEAVLMAVELGDRCMDALSYSHTAYGGEFPPTGRDHATLLRAKGFEEAGIPDPLVVRCAKMGLMLLPSTDNYKDVVL
jgi:7-cyano-7-deazaguanine synthase